MPTYVENFVTVLRALSLVEGSYKPSPLTGGSIPGHYVDDNPFPSTTTSNHSDLRLSHLNLTTFRLSVDGELRMDTQCPMVSYNAPHIADETFWSFDSAAATVYRYRRQQSVNLGSWFVQENWMVPSLFACASGPQVAEIDIASGWGSDKVARAVLERHWDTFINQSDFDYLASIGINTVRIPVGYWTLGPSFLAGTPFEPYASVYNNSWPRFVRAINMAAKVNIGVLVDLHGAPGSQNGQPHSGISDGQTRLFSNAAYMNKTLEVLTFLVKQLRNVTNIVGIEILNEPNDVPELQAFYWKAIETMRQPSSGGLDLPLYIHDGFNLQQFSTFLSRRSDFVVEDHHSYFVFSDADESEPASQHTNDIKGQISDDIGAADSKDHGNLVISEWSCALTAQSLSTQADPNEARELFCTTQMNVYTNMSAGWSFWSYTKEGCDTDPGWCFKAAVGKSLPSTFYSYGKPPPVNPTQLQRANEAVTGMAVIPESSILKKLDGAWNMTEGQQNVSIRGYSDGYQTAKIFAQLEWSRLGFTEQYIFDSVHAMGGLGSGDESYYRSAFKAGLADGEEVVSSILSW